MEATIGNFPKGAEPVGSRGKAPVRGLAGDVPQKLKQKSEISVQFLTFSCTKFRIQ